MSVDKKIDFIRVVVLLKKSHHPWFPVMFPDETGRNNIMINVYVLYAQGALCYGKCM
jgi:hypothetical protein